MNDRESMFSRPERELEAGDGLGASSNNEDIDEQQIDALTGRPKQHYTYSKTLENQINRFAVSAIGAYNHAFAPVNPNDSTSYELETDPDEQLSTYNHSVNIKDNMDYKPRKTSEQVVEQDEGPKPTYKSWKKKYRKMRVHFDAQMKKSNDFFKLEHEAAETARRLQMEIDGLMDILLDNNEPRQNPNERGCIDITHASASSAPFPEIPSKYPELMKEEKMFDLDGPLKDSAKAEYIRMVKDLHAKEAAESEKTLQLKKSLSGLMCTVPHAPFQVTSKPPSAFGVDGVSPSIAKDLEIAPGHPEPVAYLSSDRLDDLLAQIDSQLELAPLPQFNYETKYKPLAPPLSERELEFENPVSVYNWLRQNEPKIFLQDGEPASLIEKAATKPGALRGAGKRAVLPAPARTDALEIVEEDGLGYDTSIGVVPHAKGKVESSAQKRKRTSDEKDDGGYRPKGGASRPAKKGRVSTGGGRGKKGKLSADRVNEEDDEDVEMGEGDGLLKVEN